MNWSDMMTHSGNRIDGGMIIWVATGTVMMLLMVPVLVSLILAIALIWTASAGRGWLQRNDQITPLAKVMAAIFGRYVKYYGWRLQDFPCPFRAHDVFQRIISLLHRRPEGILAGSLLAM